MLGTLTQCFGIFWWWSQHWFDGKHNHFKDCWMFYRMCPTNTKNGCSRCSFPIVDYRSPTPEEDGEYGKYCRKCFYDICFNSVIGGKFPEGATLQEFRNQLLECQINACY
jgi:hypothetical protein